MKFILIDKITTLEPGKRIVAHKALSLAEEYLADHFPAFPVLPGVLMLEALTQAAAWLVRVHQDFAKSVVVLSAARNVRYASFVQPGNLFRCEVDVVQLGDELSKFKAAGYVGDVQTVQARLELRSFNLADSRPSLSGADKAVVEQERRIFRLIGGPESLLADKR